MAASRRRKRYASRDESTVWENLVMAADTRDKRMSLLGMCQAFGAPVVYPNPPDNGAVETGGSFAMWLYGYYGIPFAGAGHPVMRRWGGVTHMRVGNSFAGRSW